MHLAAHIFMRFVINVVVRECLMQFLIASGLIPSDKADVERYGIANEARHRFHRSIFDHFASYVTLASDDKALVPL